ncbi:CBS domain-containing protein [Methanomassiliicoccus luminyensis]|jgi:CBS domain-containing protein|uniref:CBS domain-containing protein n=1 Tax=Methanomassiliicoccus luminyensis TaxID=1080712 RepID=UPI000366C78A|nr:CBS domain-containing protein [Methanomassiliicoccus luminyensis]
MAALVKDYMTQKKEVVSPEDSVSSAVELMVDHDQGSVIVVDDNEKVLGIFTERDVLRHFLSNQSKFLRLKVSEVMSKPVITVTENSKVSDALKLMNEKNIRRLPVVNKDGKMVGFVSWKELFTKVPKDLL